MPRFCLALINLSAWLSAIELWTIQEHRMLLDAQFWSLKKVSKKDRKWKTPRRDWWANLWYSFHIFLFFFSTSIQASLYLWVLQVTGKVIFILKVKAKADTSELANTKGDYAKGSHAIRSKSADGEVQQWQLLLPSWFSETIEPSVINSRQALNTQHAPLRQNGVKVLVRLITVN